MAKFKFDEAALKRAVEQAASGAIADKAREYQRATDRLASQYRGRSPAEIKPALRRAVPGLSARQLDEYAQAISNGTKVTFRPGQVR